MHFVMVPNDGDGLRATLGEAHRRYTRYVNLREGWRGHLWQERFHSFPMDEAHLLMVMRYIELNPVRAGLVADPAIWRWSSGAAHLHGRNDSPVNPASALAMVDDWTAYLTDGLPEQEAADIEKHLRTGRPLGDQSFLARA